MLKICCCTIPSSHRHRGCTSILRHCLAWSTRTYSSGHMMAHSYTSILSISHRTWPPLCLPLCFSTAMLAILDTVCRTYSYCTTVWMSIYCWWNIAATVKAVVGRRNKVKIFENTSWARFHCKRLSVCIVVSLSGQSLHYHLSPPYKMLCKLYAVWLCSEPSVLWLCWLVVKRLGTWSAEISRNLRVIRILILIRRLLGGWFCNEYICNVQFQ